MIVRSAFLAVLATVLSTSAFAAVKDTDSVTLLPAGTVLVLKETVAVKPHMTVIPLHAEPTPGSVVGEKTLNLWLHIATSARDRELTAGTRWKFEKAEQTGNYYGVFLRGATEGGTVISWQFAYYKEMYVGPTIAELKTFFDVELPLPDAIPAY